MKLNYMQKKKLKSFNNIKKDMISFVVRDKVMFCKYVFLKSNLNLKNVLERFVGNRCERNILKKNWYE